MSAHHKEKGNAFALFIPFAFIAYIVYWVFTDQYAHGVHQALEADHVIVKKAEEKVENKHDLATPTKASMAQGRKVYTQSCQSCHGAEGKGDGVASDPMPRNYHNAADFKFGISYEDLWQTMIKGSPGTSMAGFDYLPEDDRIGVIHYISQWIPGSASKNGAPATTSSVTSSEGASETTAAPQKEEVTLDEKTMDKVLKKLANQ